MKAQELIRRLRRFARKRGLDFEESPGRGDHWEIWVGGQWTTLPGKRGEIKKGTFHKICRDLGIDPRDL